VLDPAAITREFVAVPILPVVPSVTLAPPAPAGPLSVTVQVADALGPKDVGLHASELMAIEVEEPRLIVPPVAVTETELPLGSAAMAPPTPIMIDADLEMVAETVATIPSAIAVVSVPLAMQVYPPDAVVHVRVLPAAANAGPAAAERLDMLAG
jgi:hypothetical protein